MFVCHGVQNRGSHEVHIVQHPFCGMSCEVHVKFTFSIYCRKKFFIQSVNFTWSSQKKAWCKVLVPQSANVWPEPDVPIFGPSHVSLQNVHVLQWQCEDRMKPTWSVLDNPKCLCAMVCKNEVHIRFTRQPLCWITCEVHVESTWRRCGSYCEHNQQHCALCLLIFSQWPCWPSTQMPQ